MGAVPPRGDRSSNPTLLSMGGMMNAVMRTFRRVVGIGLPWPPDIREWSLRL